MHLLSAHLIPLHWGQSDEEQLQRIHPRSIKVVDAFTRVPRIRELAPNSLIVYRDHPLSEQHEDMWADPEGTGVRHADDWAAKLAGWQHGIPAEQAVVLGINEPHVWRDDDPALANTPDAEGVRRTVAYTVAFLDRLTQHGIRGGALNLSVGWPANRGADLPPDWRPFEPVRDAILRGGHFLVVHEYWAHQGPDYRWGWWAGRIQQCPWDVPILIGECGMEERVAATGLPPHQWGWKGWLSAEEYVAQLMRYNELMLQDERVHSCQVFTWDFSQPFESLDIRPILPLLPANDAWDNMTRPPVRPVIATGTVTVRALNVRPGPGTGPNNRPVDVLYLGDRVDIYEYRELEDGRWARIGSSRWVAAWFLDIDGEPPTEAVAMGRYTWPVAGGGRITQRWLDNPDWYQHQYGIDGHNGLDIAAPTGTDVLAVADGVVAYVGEDPAGYGRYVRIWHDGANWDGHTFHTFHAHLSQTMVERGQRVQRGQVIGLVGSTGRSIGPHLHFEVRLADASGGYVTVYPDMGRGRVDPYWLFLEELLPGAIAVAAG